MSKQKLLIKFNVTVVAENEGWWGSCKYSRRLSIWKVVDYCLMGIYKLFEASYVATVRSN